MYCSSSKVGVPGDSKIVSELYSSLICHGDEDCRLSINDVVKRLQTFSGDLACDTEKVLKLVECSRDKFVVKSVEGKQFVEAKTSVKICDAFQDGQCKAAECEGLHICRFFLEGTAKRDISI